MKSFMLWGSVISALLFLGCSLEADVIDTGGVCAEVSCGDALVSGLEVQGDALCSSVSDAAYTDVFSCGCGDSGGPGACEAECADSLCVDAGESGACGDCLNARCTAQHNTCISN